MADDFYLPRAAEAVIPTQPRLVSTWVDIP
jgi:hypothetical protein